MLRILTTENPISLKDVITLLPLPRRLCFRRCLCLLVSKFAQKARTDLHEIFSRCWQWPINKSLNLGGDLDQGYGITDPDPYRDTGKKCLGGGMHCHSASSF